MVVNVSNFLEHWAKNLSNALYIPNPGNAGDAAIATATIRLYAVLCGNASRHVGMAGANGLAGRCLSLDMRR